MTQEKWITAINAFKNGQPQSFENLLIPYYKQQQMQLYRLTESKEDGWTVFVESMLRFKEKLMLEAISIPNNINGYIFRIQQNIWIDMCRKRNRKKQVTIKAVETQQLENALGGRGMMQEPTIYHFETQQEEEKRLVALENAINQLCDSCKKLIERNVFDKVKLKTLKIELKMTSSYQAIVEKKKRCLKKLTKLFFLELNQI